jgi:hypothetical protein
MKPKPCQCEAPNPECRRSGQPMVGRLWQLCRGVNCSPQDSALYRATWDGLPDSAIRPTCQHLGPALGEKIVCGTCAGNVRLKVFGCALHKRCTQLKPVDGAACCAGCLDYNEQEPAT